VTSQTKVLGPRVNEGVVVGFFLFTLLGLLLALFPTVVMTLAVVVVGLMGLTRLSRERMETWQLLVLVALTFFVVLNYGFENFSLVLGGMHLLVGELLMFAALGLAVFGPQTRLLLMAFREPPAICLLGLLFLALIHLAADIPRYGLFAIRDSAKYIEAVFLCLGYLWGSQKRYTSLLLKWLFVLYIVNLVYCCTFPWAKRLFYWSPEVGIFHPVALVGQYQESGLYLLTGAIFCTWLAGSVVTWPRWVLVSLATAQLCGLAVLQTRSMYVGIVVVLVLLCLLRETTRMFQFARLLPWAAGGVLGLVLMISGLGIQLQGRVGPVGLPFLEEHARSVLALGDERTRMGQDSDRTQWYSDIWERENSSPSRMIFGEGFGQPLVDFQNEEGIAVREPHNSSLSVFARLGILGLSIWLLFVLLVLRRFVRAIRGRIWADDRISRLTLFLFLYFALSLLLTCVQPALEFSHVALPFFFLVGCALGMMRWQTGEAPRSSP
jgi:hypothetical protein